MVAGIGTVSARLARASFFEQTHSSRMLSGFKLSYWQVPWRVWRVESQAAFGPARYLIMYSMPSWSNTQVQQQAVARWKVAVKTVSYEGSALTLTLPTWGSRHIPPVHRASGWTNFKACWLSFQESLTFEVDPPSTDVKGKGHVEAS